ncbi:rho guanine nucleotide exchange factor 6 isoform X1 [Pseudonaja textilis]|uniref:rho guanine nucleotide exchange factor 6 isoform X1 n=2 Tax=Pseudonaja textilis TaxID=8673 RepID=UPI000EAA1CD5|nr:rho guanine nucleotide exchange factor 6 isoform X1 [Pseudonaja textilis]
MQPRMWVWLHRCTQKLLEQNKLSVMNPEEQTVTWLISMGALNSPKMMVEDPVQFLKASLKDGVVLCKLLLRLLPGSIEKYCLEPKTEADCLGNIQQFLNGCAAALKVELFDAHDLYSGENFSKVLTALLSLNKATEDPGSATRKPCSQPLSPAPGDCQPLTQAASTRPSRVLQRQSRVGEMTENGSHQLVVKARFQFKQTNEDELTINKGDIIYVTRTEEGGWWEGTLNGKTGWFPSNYVREIKSTDKLLSPKALKAGEGPQLTKNYYAVVLQNILETEREYAKELQSLLGTYLKSLQSYDKLSPTDIASLLGNVEEICNFQQTLNQTLEECARLPEHQQRVGGCFLSLMPQFASLYLTYCTNHPSAVNVLTHHSDELEKFMENQGMDIGILTLTTSLSKPFTRLDKYIALLQELERHMEEAHPDHEDILKAIGSFRSLVTQCQEMRKRKQLELQILSETIQGWEGEDIRSMGSVLYMSQAMVQYGGNEEKEERYLMLFPSVLLVLSASPCMSGFMYKGRLSLIGMLVTKSDLEGNDHTFEISGSMGDRLTVHCNSSQDLHEWLDHLQRLTRGTTFSGTLSKTQSWGSHSTFSSTGQCRGPLEPPQILKPWTLSCLRPAPPLKPSVALSYKERMSYILKDASKSPKTMKKFLPKRKTERKASDEEFVIRKSTVALEEDAQILKVIEAYCAGASLQQNVASGSRKDSVPQVLLPEEEKLIIEEVRSNGQTVAEEKSLVDTVYALKDEVKELKQENKRMKQCLEEELKSRKDLEKLVRRLLKQTDDSIREETGRHSSMLA